MKQRLHQKDSSLLRCIVEEHAAFEEQICKQQMHINQLKDHIEKLRALPGKICAHLDQIASGFGAIQNRLGEAHLERPEGGLRYRGL